MNFMKSKKFKFGAAAVAFTLAVIAIIVVINVIVSSLAQEFSWYFPMSKATVYSISNETYKLIDTVGSDNKVTIYFLTDKERLTSSSAASYNTSQSLWGMKNIYTLATSLEDRYDFISIDYINITSEPEKLAAVYGEKYIDVYASTKFSAINVIVKNETYLKDSDGKYIIDTVTGEKIAETFIKTYTRNEFYSGDAKGYLNGFCGEFKLCSAILSVCTPASKVYFLEGHGEKIGSGDYGSAAYLATLFADAGFEVSKIDLMNESIDLSDAGKGSPIIAVMFAPQTDISVANYGTRKSESEKLDEFIKTPGCSLMLFLDENKASLDNLNALLDGYGISVENAKLKDSGAASLSVDGYTIAGDYKKSDIGDLIKNKSSKAVFKSSRVMTVNPEKGAYTIVGAPSSSSPDGKTSVKGGEIALAAASKVKDGGFVFAFGSSGFASGTNLYNSVYSNRDLLLASIKASGREVLPLNVGIKSLDTGDLDITKAQADVWTLIVSVAIPLVVVAIGTVVYVRRRHS